MPITYDSNDDDDDDDDDIMVMGIPILIGLLVLMVLLLLLLSSLSSSVSVFSRLDCSTTPITVTTSDTNDDAILIQRKTLVSRLRLWKP